MNAGAQVVVIGRVLLPAGVEPLRERFDVSEGGLNAGREEVLALAPGADAFVADPSVLVDTELLNRCGEGLRVVANFAVGYDNVDLGACRKRGVIVTNTPDVLTEATAELALALTLTAARRFRRTLRSTFDEVLVTATVWRNLPPAFVYVCRRPRHVDQG